MKLILLSLALLSLSTSVYATSPEIEGFGMRCINIDGDVTLNAKVDEKQLKPGSTVEDYFMAFKEQEITVPSAEGLVSEPKITSAKLIAESPSGSYLVDLKMEVCRRFQIFTYENGVKVVEEHTSCFENNYDLLCEQTWY